MPLPFCHVCPPAELEARLRLHSVSEIGPRRYFTLISAFGDACSALAAPAGAWRALGLPASCSDARRSARVRSDASAAMAWLEGRGQHLLMWDDPHYPALLKEIDDAPPLLYVAGEPALLERAQLAVIGSRRASPPALDNAAAFSRCLAKAGFVVTSGLALGIDGAVHRAAMDAGGQTIAVLGSGLQKLYPQRHRDMAREISERGSALVSDYPLDAEPLPGNFPRRNRIISGLSLGVLVIEAGLASGSLITARLAAEQGREVYAIPGSIHHPGAKGCHQLIRDGALLVENVEQILDSLRGWQNVTPAPTASALHDHPLLTLLHAAPHTSEGLALSSGLALSDVLAALTELELEGKVSCVAGRWFARSP